MKILAFDTSSTACSVAIQQGDTLSCLHKIAPMQQTSLILPMIQEILTAASLTLTELDAIAYGCGPGSFTGIRIACSVAQGLGFAAQKPLIPISSLAALAQAALMERAYERVLVAVDARMGQLYWAMYEKNLQEHMQLTGEELLCKTNEICLPDNKNWCGVGDAWGIYQNQLVEKLGFTPSPIDCAQLPTAQALLQLARIPFEKDNWVSASAAIPVYLR